MYPGPTISPMMMWWLWWWWLSRSFLGAKNDDDRYLFLFSNIPIFLPSTHPHFLWKRSIWDKCRRSYFSHDQFQLVTEIFWNYITNFDTHTIQTNGGRSQFSQNHVLDTYHESYLSYDNFLGRNFFDDLMRMMRTMMRMMRMIRMWKSTLLPLRPCSYWPTWPEFSRYRSFPSSLCSTWGD